MPTSAPIINISSTHLSSVERRILERLDGTPWQLNELTPEALKSARQQWRRLRSAAGFGAAGRWVTTASTNPKLAKSGVPTIGVTLHASTRALAVWKRLDVTVQRSLAAALDTDIAGVTSSLRATMCPRSTPGCVAGCVTTHSANAGMEGTDLSRLTRTLFHLHRPAAAFCLTGQALTSLHAAHGSGCRWRVNISDDVRWEHLCPGLFEIGVPAYSYTKWAPDQRGGFDGFSVVYSATERTSDQAVLDLVGAGHRVAVVFDTRPNYLPTTWRGVIVSDGNVTDDLHSHPAGTVVGLSVKGPTKALREAIAASGFARPAA